YIADNTKWFIERDDGTLFDHYYLYKLYKSNGTLVWKFDCGPREVQGEPTIGNNHLIYIVGEEHNSTGYRTKDILYAIYPNGTLKWSTTIVDKIPADLNGTLPCEQQMNWPDGVFNLAVDKDNNIYVGGTHFRSYYGDNGTMRWEIPLTLPSISVPTIYNDTVYFIARKLYGKDIGGELQAYDLNGTLKWTFGNSTHFFTYQLACDEEGTIYGGGHEAIIAVNPDGTLKWKCDLGQNVGEVRANIAVDSDKTLYVGTKNNEDSALFAIYSNGTIKWRYSKPMSDMYNTPAIGSDGNIYITNEDMKLFVINKNLGTLNCTFSMLEDGTWCSVIIDDETVYVGDMGGNLYALTVEGLSLANAPWPCLGRNIYRNYRS
ncbi:MAG: outer membrane protein assembly factor BamB family protein, partial [Candidatus Helarchaeota archaeon]